jgi:hypothetical protein
VKIHRNLVSVFGRDKVCERFVVGGETTGEVIGRAVVAASLPLGVGAYFVGNHGASVVPGETGMGDLVAVGKVGLVEPAHGGSVVAATEEAVARACAPFKDFDKLSNDAG